MKVTTKIKTALVQSLASSKSLTLAAREVGVGRSTLRRHIQSDEMFAKQCELVRAGFDGRSSTFHWNAKLSQGQIRELLELRDRFGFGYMQLARRFGVSKSQARRIVKGQQRKIG